MYEAVVYFAGPATVWAGKVAEEEIIARQVSPYRFLARAFARSTHASLDPSRCGYAVLQDGLTVEHVEPVIPPPAKPEVGKTARLGR